MNKTRYDIIASSLSSYFGVGFNTPQEQLDIDLGLVPKEFDDDAKKRMALGRNLEDGVMNYFEEIMGIKIDERNTETRYACNGRLKCKRDGRTFLEGIETGWENKVSNSSGECFIDDVGYHLQCQAYMMAFNLPQWVLAGISNGKPVYRLIKENKEMQADIEIIVDKVYNILIGLDDVNSFPWDIVEKYSKQKKLKEAEDLDQYDKDLLRELAMTKADISRLEKHYKELEEYAKNKYSDIKYSDVDFSITITSSSRKGGIDENALSIENPNLDLNKYRKPDSIFKMIKTKTINKDNNEE